MHLLRLIILLSGLYAFELSSDSADSILINIESSLYIENENGEFLMDANIEADKVTSYINQLEEVKDFFANNLYSYRDSSQYTLTLRNIANLENIYNQNYQKALEYFIEENSFYLMQKPKEEHSEINISYTYQEIGVLINNLIYEETIRLDIEPDKVIFYIDQLERVINFFANNSYSYSDSSNYSSTLRDIANLELEYNPDSDKGIKYLEKEIRIDKALKDSTLIADDLLQIAIYHYDNNNLEKALSYFDEAYDITRKINNKSDMWLISFLIANALYDKNFHYQAEMDYYRDNINPYNKKQIKEFQEWLGIPSDGVFGPNTKLAWEKRIDYTERIEDKIKFHINISEDYAKIYSPELLHLVYWMQAGMLQCYDSQNKFEAFNYLDKSIKAMKASNAERTDKYDIYKDIAHCHDYYQNEDSVYHYLGELYKVSDNLYDKISILDRRSAYAIAISDSAHLNISNELDRLRNQAEKEIFNAKDSYSLFEFHNAMFQANQRDDEAKSKKHLEEALSYIDTLFNENPEEYTNIYIELLATYNKYFIKIDNNDSDKDIYEKTLESWFELLSKVEDDTYRAYIYIEIADAYNLYPSYYRLEGRFIDIKKEKYWKLSNEHAIKALEIFKNPKHVNLERNYRAHTYQLMAWNYYWLKDFRKSKGFYKLAIKLADESGLDQLLIDLYLEVSGVYIREEDYEGAIAVLEKAEKFFSESLSKDWNINRKQKFIEYNPRIVQAKSYCYHKIKFPEILLVNADLYKSVKTKEIRGIDSDVSRNLIEIQASLKKNQAIIAYTNIDTWTWFYEAEIEEILNPIVIYIDKDIIKSSMLRPNSYYDKITNLRDSNFERYLDRLKEEDSYFSDQNDKVLNYIERQSVTNLNQSLKKYYSLLIGPIKESISDEITEITIIPDGELFEVPFEALIDNDGDYFIEKYDINYANAFSMLFSDSLNEENKTEEISILAIGDPVYDSDFKDSKKLSSKRSLEISIAKKLGSGENLFKEFHRLGYDKFEAIPYVKEEFEMIKNIFNISHIVSRENATEEKLKNMSDSMELIEYGIIHFACHGFFDSDYPELASLVLTLDKDNDSNNEGFLTLSEIEKLKINASMVNLSACQTAKGEMYSINGIDGFVQAFFNAGAESVLSTLWNINDRSAQKFMSKFYENYKISQDFNAALNQTKKQFISKELGEEYSHPYHWAPYVYFYKK